jgi:hypothetical protein
MRLRSLLCSSAALVALTAFTATSAAAATAHPAAGAPAGAQLPDTSAIATPAGPAQPSAALPDNQRAQLLGVGWQSSTDRLWNLMPGADGLSVLAAPVSQGAPWSTVASLSVAGVQSRQWIGQACVLRGSHVAAVAFGPVEYISTAAEFERGAFAATVDLNTGKVNYVPNLRPTFSYFSPKCGSDGTAEFTSFGTSESTTSVSAVTAAGQAHELLHQAPGEFTQLTRAGNRLVGAQGANLVSFTGSKPAVLATGTGQLGDVEAGPGGSVIYQTDSGSATSIRSLTGSASTVLAHGPAGKIAVDSLAGGGVAIHGSGVVTDRRAAGVQVSAGAIDSLPSLTGNTFTAPVPGRQSSASAVEISGTSGVTKSVSLPSQLLHPATPSAQLSPSVMSPMVTSSSTTDANLPCAVKRNDPAIESYQPSVDQVEWAVDQAVTGNLTGSHAANYRHYGLPAYSPQGMFPLTALSGGGSIPPQVMLGVLANESNLWQASSHVAPGGYGNGLTGNIYGRSGDALTINFSNADCGYGIAQVTDGMRTGQQSATNQTAIALDYQANIAAGINILVGKWNQLKGYGITMNDGIPSAIENWYGALWAYNSGIQPNADNGNTTGCTPGPSCTDGAGNWGLGWSNNPANPIYPTNRHFFNSQGTDAATPSHWPYQERVIGWAAYPIYEPNGSYSQAYWLSDQDRVAAIPDPGLFCDSSNHCSGASPTTKGSCALSNLHCWIHHSVTWKGVCATNGACGYGQAAYSAGAAEPADPASTDPATCSRTGLPSNAIIVDDIASPAYSPCTPTATTGSFNFTFTADANGNYPAHIDLHQINGGLDGHYWMTHTVQTTGVLPAVGTWHFPTTVNSWGKVMVHLPAQGAQTYQAHYTVTDGSTGATRTRVINTDYGQNQWVSLGSMHLGTNSTVALTSLSAHDSSSDVAWDAVAFVPGSKPAYKVVALGDSYSSGEGDPPFDSFPSDNKANGCHRSTATYSRQLKMPGQSTAAYSNSADELDLIACSGAHSVSITSSAVNSSGQENPYDTHWGSADYQNGQELQLDQGWADADTNLVTLTIGGNDARFADVVKQCYGGGVAFVNNCSDPGQVMGGDTVELRTEEPHVIRDLLPAKLTATYNAIHAAAPNAVILVGGYPRLFTPDGDDNGCFGVISKTDKLWLNSMGDLMNTTIKSAVSTAAGTGMKIHFVDPEPTFAGHEECTGTPYVNGLDLVHLEYSFHPNSDGQTKGYTPQFQAAVNSYVS